MIVNAYAEVAFAVRKGGFNVQAHKHITFNSRLGYFQARALRASILGRTTLDLMSEGKTVVKGRVVIIKADKAIYLDAPKVIASTRVREGGAPGISSALSVLQKADEMLQKIQKYLDYINTALAAFGLGDDRGGAPHMQSPPPLPTTQAPASLTQRAQLGGEAPAGGNLPVQPPEAIPTNPIAPQNAALFTTGIPPAQEPAAAGYSP